MKFTRGGFVQPEALNEWKTVSEAKQAAVGLQGFGPFGRGMIRVKCGTDQNEGFIDFGEEEGFAGFPSTGCDVPA